MNNSLLVYIWYQDLILPTRHKCIPIFLRILRVKSKLYVSCENLYSTFFSFTNRKDSRGEYLLSQKQMQIVICNIAISLHSRHRHLIQIWTSSGQLFGRYGQKNCYAWGPFQGLQECYSLSHNFESTYKCDKQTTVYVLITTIQFLIVYDFPFLKKQCLN